MAGLLDIIRRAAPGAAPTDPYDQSVMSPRYVPETSGRNLRAGAVRGLLDVSPVGLMDAAQAGMNRLPMAVPTVLRGLLGRQPGVGEAGMEAAGLRGSGAGYDAARMGTAAALPMMGLLGNQSAGTLPAGYRRNEAGAIVWHGSPHRFDKFDASKIGTGEGAQAYGHGLYFAESKDVAKSYRDKLTTGVSAGADGQAAYLLKMYRTPERALEAARAEITPNLTGDARKFADDVVRVLEAGSTPNMGALYKVDLPDDAIAKMLDYGAPPSAQPEAVRKALASMTEADLAALPKGTRVRLAAGNGDGMTVYNAFGGYNDPAGAAQRLRALGVPGVKYFDGGSRAAGAGTRNYVVFPGEEGLLKILGRE